MKKLKQNLFKLVVIAGIITLQTRANAQCILKVQLESTPTNCKNYCSGTATVLNPENIPLEFLWSNGATVQTITGLCEGTVAVTVWQGGEGCMFNLNTDVVLANEVQTICTATVPTAPGTITTNTTGGVPPYTYEWFTTPHQYTSSITNLAAGSYFVIVTDVNGCSDYTSCDILPGEPCTGRTQTMGGWGANPHGHNPAAYLYSKFALAFPTGAEIGCTNNVRLTTPQAVTDFLPCSGTPKVLPAGTAINPGGSMSNTLAGQAMALTLSLGFDSYDPDFNPGDVYLGDQLINGGPFDGMTVSALLAEANNKLGGCATSYTISQLNKALTSVNQNYVGGTVDNGYLYCPKKSKFGMETSSDVFSYAVKPNPATDNATLSIVSANDDRVSIDIYNMVGKKVAKVNNETVHAQEEMKFNINTSDFSNGIYIINITTSEKMYQQKLVINK